MKIRELYKKLHFIVVGDENTGRRCFIDKAVLDFYEPRAHILTEKRAKFHPYKNENFCIFFDSKNQFQPITRDELVDAFFITLDASQIDETKSNWIESTEFHINRIAKYYPQKPIVLLVTKADQSPCDHNLMKRIITNLRNQNYNVSYIETSAKDGLNIEQAVNLAVDMTLHQAEIERQSAKRRKQVAKTLMKDLNQYTSLGNKLIAYGKLVLSFGQFGLAARKQALAEQIKSKTSINVEHFKKLNKDLVEYEFNHSCFFAKRYTLSNSQENIEPTLDLGELGRILNKAKI
ncbi:hypothetical protein Lbir_1327 [Legionella birminghamensis]|uniref:Rho GTPase (Miro-like) n=1 Tax=Legionella birminghamensis TaxID=28083 RepID=A0A378IAD0_9GAMM|nr:hypothetical protein [Legionella birminghamensis]KTC72552.1 hypothetical protein Lbir_1327 [Legionella birminghamensis]STX32139.1 Uncharacterised protein [Legionella birminghamensis]